MQLACSFNYFVWMLAYNCVCLQVEKDIQQVTCRGVRKTEIRFGFGTELNRNKITIPHIPSYMTKLIVPFMLPLICRHQP